MTSLSTPTPIVLPASRLVITSGGGGVALAGSLDTSTVAEARRAGHAGHTDVKGAKDAKDANAKAKAKANKRGEGEETGTRKGAGSRRFDLSALTELDTAGALLLCAWQERGDTPVGLRADHARLVKLIAGLDRSLPAAVPRAGGLRRFIVGLGRAGTEILQDLVEFIEFTGRAAASIGRLLVHPGELRPSAIAHHIVETGVKALPIVGLLAVIISIVIAYQGVAQLRPYGGQDLTIDLVSVSVLREFAVLITAILVPHLRIERHPPFAPRGRAVPDQAARCEDHVPVRPVQRRSAH